MNVKLRYDIATEFRHLSPLDIFRYKNDDDLYLKLPDTLFDSLGERIYAINLRNNVPVHTVRNDDLVVKIEGAFVEGETMV